jgi:hypothetical protein
MNGGIFIIQDDGELIEMSEHKYDSEDLLQELLEKYPNLLAGDQIDSKSPRRWLLISREFGVPSEEEGGDRWSIDHLFLDQDAVPTLVEVKRSSDTRIRREVVGQMLDYAANAVVYWPVETIIAKFEARCQMSNSPAETVLDDFLEDDIEQEEFWQKVKTNIQAGKVRLVFVADEIPPELRRVVEFMNAQMDPAEVLAVEIRQYMGKGLKTLVPRVIGQTEEAQRRKGGAKGPKVQWDETSFFAELDAKCDAAEVNTARKILEWGKARGLRIWWGKGRITGSFSPVLDHKEINYPLLLVWTTGNVQVQFGVLQTRPPFDVEHKRLGLLQRFRSVPGLSFSEDALNKYPSFPLAVLKDEFALEQFIEVLDWFVEEIRSL